MFSGYPLNTFLGQTCITANNTLVPMFFVSDSLVNAQMPYEVSGATTVVVHTPDGASPGFHLTVPDASPAIWLNGKAGPLTGLPLIYRVANGQLLTGSNPAHRNSNESLLIYLTGMGRVAPAVESGTRGLASTIAAGGSSAMGNRRSPIPVMRQAREPKQTGTSAPSCNARCGQSS